MKKVFIVRLTETERAELNALVRKGKASALAITRARILLTPGKTGGADKRPRRGSPDVPQMSSMFADDGWRGLEAALRRKNRMSISHANSTEAEAKLVATCCGPAPQGRARWTLRMLAGKLVELEVVDSISPETVRSTLKKMRLSLG
jgi:hypothetical protein